MTTDVPYDSGGKHRDDEKFKQEYDRIFSNVWPCRQCKNTRTQGHKLSCTEHWRNKYGI